MSIIAGIFNFHNHTALEDGQRMMQALHTYPADDIRYYADRSLFIGCAARWITPESVNQPQPFYNPEHQIVIAADVIIDNRQELFERLQVDYGLRNNITDSELILLAYLKWGEAVCDYLIGDYAFVLWDVKQQLLFGARDPLGNRTLYYSCDEHHFSFCTMITPLFAVSGIHRKLNEAWLADFLAISDLYDTNDAESTPYSGIKQLPPSHYFTVKNTKLRVVRRNALFPVSPLKLSSDGEYIEAFQSIFHEATTARLRTFRQVGATLSGGLDSGAVVSEAASALRLESKVLHTYSYIPPDDFEDFTSRSRIADERPYIQATVHHVGNIHDTYVNLPGKSPFTEIDSLLQTLEAPYKNFENSYWIKGIYEQASQHEIGILLTGARGNHTISWGSTIDYCTYLLQKFKYIRFHHQVKAFSRQAGVRRAKLIPILFKNAYPFLDRARTTQATFPSMINPEFEKSMHVLDRMREQQHRVASLESQPMKDRDAYFSNASILSFQGSLAAKLSLPYGIWERDPTADVRVIRFCFSLPIEQFIQRGVGRSVVRRATEHRLPDQVRLNQHIRGAQGVDWIHRMLPSWKEFTAELNELCSDAGAAQYLYTKQIQDILRRKEALPKSEQALDLEFRYLMRNLITYRFLKTLKS